MGALMRSHDWSATPLGSPETWPQSLRTTVRLLLTTQHPMFTGGDLSLSSSTTTPTVGRWDPSATQEH